MIRTAQHLATLPAGEHKCITIRTAMLEDVPFLDHLQKRYREQLGFLPRCALEEHVAHGRVSLALENDEPAAYLIGKGNYLDDPHFGIIFQAAVSYDARRRLIGTALVQHLIDHMEPNVRLIGLWCAQDIEANEFWSACGFEAIAARHGSKRRGRVHIFWVGRTPGRGAHEPLRYPRFTRGGLMRERREVFGLAAGREYKDVVLPETESGHQGIKAPRHRGGKGTPASGGRHPKLSLMEMQRAFRYGQTKHICVVIAGVTKYLPVAPMELPDFADVARVSVSTPAASKRIVRAAGSGELWTPAPPE